jgi:hypothetical protein
MNANTLAKHYDLLGPEERFRLILAAGARGDDAEQERLCQAAPRITLSYSHHAPWARAFDQLATLIYVELLEEVAKHEDAFERYCDVAEDFRKDHEKDAVGPQEDEAEDEDGDEEIPDPASITAKLGPETRKPLLWVRMLGLYYAQGFVLRTKLAGWKLFCERLTLPPFELWKLLPGFDRLQRAIDLLEDHEHGPPPAFQPEGMVHWLNEIRPEGAPEASLGALLSPSRVAHDLESAFRQVVEWWGG